MRAGIAIGMVIGLSSTVRADPPGLTPPYEPEEQVSEIQQIVGPVVAFTGGFGLGHVVEGRWHERGWIFTLGETLAFGSVAYGSMNMECVSRCELAETSFYGGFLAFMGLRIWQTVDAVRGAREKNARV